MTPLAAFGAAAVVTLIVTPVAVLVARHTGFYDHPVGYKGHLHPTPYLGGAAVFAGLAAGLSVATSSIGRFSS